MATKKTGVENIIDIDSVVITSPKIYEVAINGIEGLLMNRPPDMSVRKTVGPKQAKVDRLQLEYDTWQDKAYQRDGQLYIPGENLHESFKSGCRYWGAKIPGEGNKTYTDLVASAAIIEDMPLGKTIEEAIPFGRNVNGTPTGKKPSLVYKIRPLIRPWAGVVRVHVFDARLSVPVLKAIVAYAGTMKGVCDWRPKFGRYALASITEV